MSGFNLFTSSGFCVAIPQLHLPVEQLWHMWHPIAINAAEAMYTASAPKAIALGADAVYIASAALIAMGCHMCQSCSTGKCNWGIATQNPELVKRLNPDIAYERLINLLTAWNNEIKEMLGGMGINAIDSLRGNRLMLRGVGLNLKELEILGIKHAGE